MKTTKIIMLFLLVLAVAIVPVLGQDEETLSIAFIGSNNDADQALYHAAVLAATEINALSGDDELVDADDTSYELEVIFYEADTEREALDAYEDAVEDDVIAILGPNDRDSLESLADEGSISTPIFHAVADGPSGNGFYRLVADYTSQAEIVADYLVNQRGFSNLAVAAADTANAQDAREAFITAAEADGAEIIVDASHAADATNLRDDAEEIRESGAEALFMWTLDSQALRLLEALREEGWDGLIVYNNLSQDFIADAGDLAEGLISPTTWLASAYDSESQVFQADYLADWGSEATSNSAAYYDAVYLLAEAVREGGENASSQLGTLGEYDGVQAVYTNAQAEDLLLVEAWGGTLVEQARYENGLCMNCLSIWRGETDSSTIESRDTLLIALLVPTTGPNEATGIAIENAVELAVDEINELGGLVASDNILYTLVVKSYSANNSAEVATALQTATEDGAAIVLGLDFNALVLDNIALLGQVELPQLLSATDRRIPVLETSDHVLQIRTNDAAIAETSIAYLLDEREVEGISTVAVRSDYAREAQNAAEDAIAASEDGRLELSLNYSLAEGDFTAIADDILNSETEAVIVWSPTQDAVALLDALELAAWDGIFVYPYLNPDNLANFASETIEVVAVANWWANAGDWGSIRFSTDYFDAYGTNPLPQTVSYYDAVYWFAAGIEEVGLGATALNDWLLDSDTFYGVQGLYNPLEYGDGETIRNVIIGNIGENGFEELARYQGTTCFAGCEN